MLVLARIRLNSLLSRPRQSPDEEDADVTLVDKVSPDLADASVLLNENPKLNTATSMITQTNMIRDLLFFNMSLILPARELSITCVGRSLLNL